MEYKVHPYFGGLKGLNKRFTIAEAEYRTWESMHREAMDYVMPERNTFYVRTPGKKENRMIYDSTAVEGLDVFVNKVQSGFFPDWLNWMEFRAGEEVPDDAKEDMNKELETITNAFFGHFHQSNFSTEINPTLKDWAIGTGCIEVEAGVFGSDDSLFKFTNVPLPELYVEHTSSGPIKSSWRCFELEIEQIEMNWPKIDLGEDLLKIKEKNPLEKIQLLSGHLYNPETKTFQHYILKKKGNHLLYFQEFKTQRRIVFRATKSPGESYGRGPVIRLLPDIQSANKIVEFYLKNAALHVAGMYTGVDDGVFNPYTLEIKPGVVVPVTSNNSQNPTLTRMNLSGDIGLSQLVLEDYRTRINQAFMAMPMGDIQDPVKSATEQMLRHQDDTRRSSTSNGRLYSELINPVLRACFDIGSKAGKLPDIAINGRNVKVKMVSPLAKQKEMEDFTNSQIWFSMIMQLPEMVAMGTTKMEKLSMYWAEKLGVPLDLVRSLGEQQLMGKTMVEQSQNMEAEQPQ